MDIGSLGYLPIAAHRRADALAVTLSAAGRGLVFDPGTASYYGKPPWRGMDRGTRPEWVGGPRAPLEDEP
jgi:Heparinase II/III-like protein